MLFHSPEFLFAFLPLALLGYYLLGRLPNKLWAVGWLAAASLFFYGWWNVAFLPMLLISLGLNYLLGIMLVEKPRPWLLLAGVAANLAAIGFFKYAGFLVEILNALTAADVPVPHILLPLAISFYTFQQIAYLVDCHEGRIGRPNPVRYAMFITFFPQLIAGPIVHYREIVPQIERDETFRIDQAKLVLGFTVFCFGLFKKIGMADTLAPLAQPLWDLAAGGEAAYLAFAWRGAVAFALQLYFDFSGYSDMAIGLGLMFGILLPFNFDSPYKSQTIIEFWSRWHITLTRFLTAYLYNPITKTVMRRRMERGQPVWNPRKPQLLPFLVMLAFPTLVTMGLAGVWHGAGWQFIVFGLLHGAMLVANHGWRATSAGRARIPAPLSWLLSPVKVLVTFLAVTVSFVFFKSPTLTDAMTVVRGLVGMGEHGGYLYFGDTVVVLFGLFIIWALPNTQEWVGLKAHSAPKAPARERARFAAFYWKPSPMHGLMVGAVLCITLLRIFGSPPAEFLYFAF
ncbi:MBOAT family O-acyltransferase [Cereibacter sphaeroides f. sp. denitrificans]|uniref:Probable alginate O-acetylase AlgI n=1 Tax=Cereibacter johrii TaxID=445629 RepID=A0ABX5J346_9RHOB|nr:MBOAT family O-acyltransferase [Cereibacter johrii]PTM76194.1 D-alanyl-lipoteichoic acid acyltransferase DltB (MBOAT superfamily) [Cereibacter johrii]RDS97634.1 MBOAT family protein [Cereibacter sphaeroides f. sp. denitrificans]